MMPRVRLRYRLSEELFALREKANICALCRRVSTKYMICIFQSTHRTHIAVKIYTFEYQSLHEILPSRDSIAKAPSPRWSSRRSAERKLRSSRADLGRYRTNLSAMHDEINTRAQRKYNAAFFYGTSGAAVAKLCRRTTGGTLWLGSFENRMNDEAKKLFIR